MDAKAFTEGMRALCLRGALLADMIHACAGPKTMRQAADDMLSGLMTPVIKGYGTDKGYDVATNAQQVLRRAWLCRRMGHGAICPRCPHHHDLRRRERRAGDGPGRAQAGAEWRACGAGCGSRLVDDECAAAKDWRDWPIFAGRLEKANGELKAATMWFMQNGMANPDNVGAGAYHYMHIMGIVALWVCNGCGWAWRLAAGRRMPETGDAAFYEAKLVTARYFAERFFPDCGSLRRKIEAGSEAIMALSNRRCLRSLDGKLGMDRDRGRRGFYQSRLRSPIGASHAGSD